MNKLWQAGLLLLVGCTNTVAIFRADELDGAVDAERDGGDSGAGPDGGGADAELEEDASQAPVFTSIAAFGHSCVAGAQGLFCWGRNRDGQLGLAANGTPAVATAIQIGQQQYTQACAAEQHSCALRVGGSVECWGNNERGQLGLADTTQREVPTAIPGHSFLTIACGGRMSCGVNSEQRVLCWGENAEGALGQADDFGSPDLLVPSAIAVTGSFRQVSVGQGHACAVAETGELYCWGRNASGQLGLGGGAVQVRTPTLVDGAARYKRVAAGQNHSCGVRVDGTLYCWGRESDGQLGLGAPESDRAELPRQVAGAAYEDVQANWFHTCALQTGGRLSCWGRNLEGQLGIGDTMGRGREEPAAVLEEGWTAVAVGQFHSCGLRDSAVYCWGKNDADSELGIGSEGRRDLPSLVRFP